MIRYIVKSVAYFGTEDVYNEGETGGTQYWDGDEHNGRVYNSLKEIKADADRFLYDSSFFGCSDDSGLLELGFSVMQDAEGLALSDGGFEKWRAGKIRAWNVECYVKVMKVEIKEFTDDEIKALEA